MSGVGGAENGRRRVVVTGVGAVTPLGNDVESTWENLIAGRSGAGPITAFDPTGYFVNFACEVKDLDRKSTRLNSSHIQKSRMPSSA